MVKRIILVLSVMAVLTGYVGAEESKFFVTFPKGSALADKKEVWRKLENLQPFSKIRIQGCSDSDGTKNRNKDIRRWRAEAISRIIKDWSLLPEGVEILDLEDGAEDATVGWVIITSPASEAPSSKIPEQEILDSISYGTEKLSGQLAILEKNLAEQAKTDKTVPWVLTACALSFGLSALIILIFFSVKRTIREANAKTVESLREINGEKYDGIIVAENAISSELQKSSELLAKSNDTLVRLIEESSQNLANGVNSLEADSSKNTQTIITAISEKLDQSSNHSAKSNDGLVRLLEETRQSLEEGVNKLRTDSSENTQTIVTAMSEKLFLDQSLKIDALIAKIDGLAGENKKWPKDLAGIAEIFVLRLYSRERRDCSCCKAEGIFGDRLVGHMINDTCTDSPIRGLDYKSAAAELRKVHSVCKKGGAI